jgi:hypothetical protein
LSTDLVAEAIDGRRMLSFVYGGEPRTVVPARVGANRRGRDTVHAYQVSGGSASGTPPHWRNFRIERMTDLELLDQTFAADPPGYLRGRYFTSTYAALEGVGFEAPTSAGNSPSGHGGGAPQIAVPPAVAEAAEKVMGAVGRWFKKRG